MRRLLPAWLCVLFVAGLPQPAAAELRALLVGVSGYLPPTQPLQGPPVAVQRLREVLLQRGAAPGRITTLADGVPGAAMPKRAAVLAALDDLARDARPGDVVVVLFAGHGSRQPDPARPGSLMPTLLPLDIGRWEGGEQPVVNAITRDEVRAAIDRIAASGAFVWAVFDACHSAGLVRGTAMAKADVETAEAKALLAGWLAGMEPSAEPPDTTPGTGGRRSGQGPAPEITARAQRPGATQPGRAAYFYAAQGSEFTGELAIETGNASGGATTARRHGLFSHVLTQLLDEARGPISYRQLAEALLASYRLLPRARLTPVFAGNGLDARVLGQDSVPVRQWPLQSNPAATAPKAPWWVAAGRVQGIAVGARFAVLPDALSPDNRAITQLEAVQVDDDHSLLALLPPSAIPAAGGAAVPVDPSRRSVLQAEVNQLRLLTNGLAYTLRVAHDTSGCMPSCALRDAVQQLRNAGVEGVDLRWVEPGGNGAEQADVVIRNDQGRVLLLEQAGPAATATPGATTRWADALVLDLPAGASSELLAHRLAQRLHVQARLRNLSQLAARSALEPLQAILESSVRRLDTRTPHAAGALGLRHGDRMLLSLRNRGADPIDVTVLYLDANGGIVKIHPTVLGEVNRLEAGDTREVVIKIGPPAVGAERVWAIAAVRRPREPTVDFGLLEQPALARRRDGRPVSVDIGDDLAAFADAAFAAHVTRGLPSPRPPSNRTLIRSHELDVQR
jgi:hypothetical protein